MASVRRRVRSFATAWLVFQLAWLSALVPRDCCAAHRPAATSEHSCHQAVSSAQCPMRVANGRPCAMHRSQTGHAAHHQMSAGGEHRHDSAPPAECSLRGTCNGPMAGFLAFQSIHAILPVATASLPDADPRSVTTLADEHLIGRFQPPDAPPPRA